jgi:DNA-binding MarR family transcriptional regulator
MLCGMRTKRNPDYHADVYLYICNTIRATGEFPSSTEITQALNLNYQTVYNALKVLESHGLIERRRGKREAGRVRVESRVVSRVKSGVIRQ